MSMAMDNPDYKHASELVNELEAFLKENALPTYNENAVRRIRFLCNRISTFSTVI